MTEIVSASQAMPDPLSTSHLSPPIYISHISYPSPHYTRKCEEMYIRQDIGCVSADCDRCREKSSVHNVPTPHPVPLLSSSSSFYLLPSISTLHRFFPFFLHHTALPILLSRTHFLEHKLRRRLLSLMESHCSTQHVAILENEYMLDVHCPPESNESIQQHRERSISTIAAWYQKHMNGKKLILLLDEPSCAANSSTSDTRIWQVSGINGYVRCNFPALFHFLSNDVYRHIDVNQQLYTELIRKEQEHMQMEQSSVTSLNQQLSALQLGTIPTVTPSANTVFPQHYPLSPCLAAVSAGLLHRGHLRVDKYSPSLFCYLPLPANHYLDRMNGALIESQLVADSTQVVADILIVGQLHRNRAMDGDEVIVELLPRVQWRQSKYKKKQVQAVVDEAKEEGEETGEEANQVEQVEVDNEVVPTGKIVCIVKRHWRPYVCTLYCPSSFRASDNYHYVIPMDMRIPKIFIVTRQAAQLVDKRIVVHVDEWLADQRVPSGHYVEILGDCGNLEVEVRCLLMEYQISHPPFTRHMLGLLPHRDDNISADAKRRNRVGSGYHSRGADISFQWTIPMDALQNRRDLRTSHRECVFSIDPIGCVDIDDALSCKVLDNGHIEYGVHIADVSYFIPFRSTLDLEAQQRATSVYLVDRRLDMLPLVLSEDICSLRGGTERLCISCLWEMDETGKVIDTWIGRTAIYNSYSLSYEEAQYILDTNGGTQSPPTYPATHPLGQLTLQQRYLSALQTSLSKQEMQLLYPKIKHLWQRGLTLRAGRLQQGALELDSITINFEMTDDKRVSDVVDEAHLEMHAIIAEWMVYANQCVAYYIYQYFPTCSLLRHHTYPTMAKFRKLIEFAKSLDIPLKLGSNRELADSLEQAEKLIMSRQLDDNLAGDLDADAMIRTKKWLLKTLKDTAARAMSEAHYFSTGQYTPSQFFHYGLSVSYYTHFTSPIRRYADLVVHRQVVQCLEIEAWRKQQYKLRSKLQTNKEVDESQLSTVCPISALFSNEELQSLADHLNKKNRNATFVSKDSQELFLAQFLITPSSEHPSCSLAYPRVERAEAIIVSLRANGAIILIPRFHVKGPLLLCNNQHQALLSHPLAPVYGINAFQLVGPQCNIKLVEERGTLTCTLEQEFALPRQLVDSMSYPLPRSHTFHIFDTILVDITLQPQLSKYHTPKPQFRLVWSQENWKKQPDFRQLRSADGPSSIAALITSHSYTHSDATAAPCSNDNKNPTNPPSSTAPAAPNGGLSASSTLLFPHLTNVKWLNELDRSQSISQCIQQMDAPSRTPPISKHTFLPFPAPASSQTAAVPDPPSPANATISYRHQQASRYLFSPNSVIPADIIQLQEEFQEEYGNEYDSYEYAY